MSNRISKEAFNRGVEYVLKHARPLDTARIERFISGGDASGVLAALAPFQNEDGGFGHGIEPDFRTPASTALATSVGLQVLRGARVGAENEMVRAAMAYLLTTLDRSNWVWPIIDHNVDLAPHAPWWSYSDTLADAWNGFRFNPTAELIGYCFDYSELVPDDVLQHLGKTLAKNLEDVGTLATFFDLRCCLTLHDTATLPESIRNPLGQVLLASAEALSPTDPHANFLELVPAPGSLLHAVLEEPFEQYADRIIHAQHPDGFWAPWWEWAEVSASGWKQAEADWRGILTRHTLETLTIHGLVK